MVDHPGNGFDAEFATPAEWARLYRSHDIQIVPAFMPGEAKGSNWKRPLLRQWTQYQDVLVGDDVFEPWYGPAGQYRQRPNMGVITGKASGNLFVIDLDIHTKPQAAAWWGGLMERENHRLELETVEQRTGGGGLQKLFYAPAGWTPPTCKTDLGVDIRGQGGFAMLCPSLHESGRAYEWLEGRSPDEIDIAMAPDWLLAAVEELVVAHGGSGPAPGGARPRGANGPSEAFDGFGHQTDMREDKMFRMVFRCVVQWHRICPIKPGDAESARKARDDYEIYERGVNPQKLHPADLTKTQKLDREDRGWEAWWGKWQYAMRHWEGKIREAAAKPDPHPEGVSHETGYTDFTDEFAKASNPSVSPQLYDYLDFNQILAMPDPVWLVNDLINERSLGFVFGPPGSLKTFIALDLALSIAARQPTWWNRSVNSHGAVIYLCREGTRSLKFRLRAWQQHRKASGAGCPFYLIEKTINFMDGADVGVLVATIREIAAVASVPIVAVFVDTVSRVLPGAKENQQEDMSLFVGACEVVQSEFGCVVVGIHHVNKNGTIRGSTVIPGAGDFLIETRREPGVMYGSIVIQKVKDGEDGQELPFKVTKVELGGIVPRSSLMVDPDGTAKAAGAAAGNGVGKDGLPDIMVCREILAALAMAWFQKMPWSSANNSARPAVQLIMARWSLKRDVVKRLLAGWMANGIIEYAVYDTKGKAFGYRKLIDL